MIFQILNLIVISLELLLAKEPQIQIYHIPSIGKPQEVELGENNSFTLPRNVIEIRFGCFSTYPNKWRVIPSPYFPDSSITDLSIDKGRLRAPLGNSDSFWSELTFRLVSGPGRVLYQEAACHHFNDTSVNTNVRVHTAHSGGLEGELVSNDEILRKNKIGWRYGRNKNCSLIMHLDLKKKKLACENLEGFTTTAPDIIKCANLDECEASIRQSNSKCTSLTSYEPIQLGCPTKNCVPFGNESGALVCEYVGGGRPNSLAQILFATLDNEFYRYSNSEKEPKLSQLLRIQILSPSAVGDVYVGTKVKFRCSGVMWHFSKGFQWLREDLNGTVMEQEKSEEGMEGRISYTSTTEFLFNLGDGNVKVICKAPKLNSYEWEEVFLTILVKESKLPVILNLTETSVSGQEKKLYCKSTGIPTPFLTWWRNGVEIKSEVSHVKSEKNVAGSVLVLAGSPKADRIQNYVCKATNVAGSSNSTITIIDKKTGGSQNLGVIVGVPISFAFLLLIIGYLFWIIWDKNRQIQLLTEDEIQEFKDGNPDSQDLPHFFPYNTDFEIQKKKIIFESKVLGDGQFGRVTRGRIGKAYVAIKTVKKLAEISYLKALLSELKICCYVGRHENIVNLIGGNTENIQKREVYLIYEYCANGNLCKYLKKYREQFVNHLVNGKYKVTRESTIIYQNISGKKVSSKDLLRWGGEIASGMEFIGAKNILHGDLAARNILLTDSLQAKVGDFGLSKQLGDSSIYTQRLECPLPLRWMAIESLRDLQFSVSSDIWSYGVTLWEIYSLAKLPYAGLEWDCSSWKKLADGYRMEKPEFASDDIYDLMLKCWNIEPGLRPPFSFLRNFFEAQLLQLTRLPSIRIG